MHKIKLLMVDIDETLLTHGKEVSDVNKAMIEKLLDDGVFVVPTTGRYYNGIPEYLRNNKRIKYIVSSNGALIKNETEILKRLNINKDEVVEILTLVDKHAKHIFVVSSEGIIIDERLLLNRKHEEKGFFKRLMKQAIITDNILDFVKDNDLNIKKVEFSFDDLEFRNKLYEKLLSKTTINTAASHYSNIEVTNRDASKGLALQHLIDVLKINKDEVMAIGDNDNDISMLEVAGISVAMGNASDNVKSYSDYVTADVKEDGFAQAVRKYFNYK